MISSLTLTTAPTVLGIALTTTTIPLALILMIARRRATLDVDKVNLLKW